MKKIILIFIYLIVTHFITAQTVDVKLEGVVVLKVDNNVVVCGFDRTNDQVIFKAKLYDKEFKLIKEYEKLIPGTMKNVYPYIYNVENTISVRAVAKPEDYLLKLNSNLEELSFNPINSGSKSENKKVKTQYENKKIELPINALIKNDKVFLSIDKKAKKVIITRESIIDSKLEPIHVMTWESVLDNYEAVETKTELLSSTEFVTIKGSGIISITEKEIIGCFFTKDGMLVNFKLDAKTGEVKNITSNSVPETQSDFSYSASYVDPDNGNFIIAGKKMKTERIEKLIFLSITDFVLLMICDKNGNLIKTQKIAPAEYKIEEPNGFAFKGRGTDVLTIGKLRNGNYYIDCKNTTPFIINGTANTIMQVFYPIIGFSYYEVDKNLNIINSNLFIENDFSNKNTSIKYKGTLSDGKHIAYTETETYTLKIKLVNVSGNENEESTLLFEELLDQEKKADLVDVIIIEDRLIYYAKNVETGICAFNSILIR
jgi:hypothetical protein